MKRQNLRWIGYLLNDYAKGLRIISIKTERTDESIKLNKIWIYIYFYITYT